MSSKQPERTAEATEAFPSLTDTPQNDSPSQTGIASYIPAVIRSNTMRFLQADMPRGASGMTAQTWANSPTITEVRQGAYTTEGEERWRQFENSDTPSDFRARRTSLASRERSESKIAGARKRSVAAGSTLEQDEPDEITSGEADIDSTSPHPAFTRTPTVLDTDLVLTNSGTYPNGYKFPPKHTWKQATAIGFRAFINFTFRTWFGFILTFYAVQVVGWGAMIFLLLCTAGDPRMCWLQSPPGSGHWIQDCSSKHTSKSRWIEIDAQVLTALFCVTAFGLAPWRCRDVWHICQYRIWHEHLALRKLAAAHKGWFRLPGSHHLDPLVDAASIDVHDAEAQALVPYPPRRAARPPLTGVRALPVTLWKMDFVVWLMFLNTVFQIPLCGVMWGLNRFNRPSWTTALLIVLGMLSAMAAGIMQFIEGKKIKQREGVPVEAPEVDKGLEMEAEEGGWDAAPLSDKGRVKDVEAEAGIERDSKKAEG